jgi:hypothetical protein
VAERAKDVAFLGDAASLSSANRVVPMRLPAKLHYAWFVAAVTFVALLLTTGVRAAPSILIVRSKTSFIGRVRQFPLRSGSIYCFTG